MAILKDTTILGDARVTDTLYANTLQGNLELSYIQGADDIKAIEALTDATGFLKKTAENTWSLDNDAYSTTDTHVNVSLADVAISHNYILMTSTAPTSTATAHTALGATSIWVNSADKDKFELVLGNSTATSSSGGQYGQLALYSASSAGTRLKAADGTSWKTATLQAKDGIIALISDIPTNLNQLTNGPGYVTSSGVTSITLSAGAGISLDSTEAITTTGTRTISISGIDTTNGSETECLTKKGTWKTFSTSTLTIGTGASDAAAGNHIHGNITNDGCIATAIIPTGDDYLIIGDNSASGKLGKGPTFVSTTDHKFLKDTGAFAAITADDLPAATTSAKGAVIYGTAANTACMGNDSRLSDARTPTSHTHGNITNDGKMSGTSVSGNVTTSHKFLREDGTWVVPAYTTNTDVAVKQTNTTGDANYSLLLSYTANTDAEKTEQVRKCSSFYYNTSSHALVTGGTINGYTLAAACAKAVDTSLTIDSTSTNLPTSAAVAELVSSNSFAGIEIIRL